MRNVASLGLPQIVRRALPTTTSIVPLVSVSDLGAGTVFCAAEEATTFTGNNTVDFVVASAGRVSRYNLRQEKIWFALIAWSRANRATELPGR